MYHHVKTDDTGWVLVLKSDGKTMLPLCSHTKVQVITKKNERTLFKICDGPNKDLVISMRSDSANAYLSRHPGDAPSSTEALLTVVYKKRERSWYSKARNQHLD